jgi:hypothetical protein
MIVVSMRSNVRDEREKLGDKTKPPKKSINQSRKKKGNDVVGTVDNRQHSERDREPFHDKTYVTLGQSA